MTDTKNEWVARVPPSYSISGNVQWNRVFDERDVRSLVFRCNEELTAARDRIAELEKDDANNLRAIGEVSGAMYEPSMGPTWPGSWDEQVSVIRGLRESQRHETDRFLRIEELVSNHGCDCECGCSAEEHSEGCERCFACKVDAALRGVTL